MSRDSVNQEFRQDAVEMVCHCFTMSGASAGKTWRLEVTQYLGLESSRGIFIHLCGGWCWLSAGNWGLLTKVPIGGPFVWHGLPYNKATGFKQWISPQKQMVHLLGLSPQVMQRHSYHSHRLTQMDREGAEIPCVHEKGVKVILKEEQGTGDLSAVIFKKIQSATLWNFIFLGSKITADGNYSHEIKRRLLLERKVMTNLDSILRSRDITLPTKVCLVKAIIFPVFMYGWWELEHKESWVLKNWYFQIVMLEKTLESPLDYKEIQPVNPKGNQSWIFIGRTDAEAETLILWLPNAKNWLVGKDPDAGKEWRQEEKGTAEDEMVR